MDEKKGAEQPAENIGEGSKYETTPLIERAREERERLEAANRKKEELLNREEEIMAHRQLGGMSEAGTEKPKEEEISNEEYAKRAMEGKLNG